MISFSMRKWMVLVVLLILPADADWRNTVNKAGEQMILSEKMTKEFCLIAAGKNVEANKQLLLATIDTFQNILNAMLDGDESQGIVECNTPDVLGALNDIVAAWTTYKAVLLENLNTIRRADGSTDMEVLQEVSQRALPVHDASALLLSRLMIQANAALKYMPSVIEDLLFRQRTIIQRLAKGLLLLSQGVDVLKNADEFGDTIILFETSLRGILRGVPFAGLPVMTQLCPMIQMAQVTRFYQDVRPLLSATLSADGEKAIQAAALMVVDESVTLMEILFNAMMDAARLIMENENNCRPWESMTGNDWFRFMEALVRERLLIQRITQEVMQVAVQVNAKAAQVEIIVHKAQADENFRNMIEGNWIKGIPPAGTQRMLKHLQDSWIVWQSMDMEVTEVVQLDEVSEVLIARVFRSSRDILFEMDSGVAHGLEMVTALGIPGVLLNTVATQAVLVSKITELACSISRGNANGQMAANWDLMNASRAQLTQNYFIILQGTQGNDTSVPKATNVCLVQQLKAAMDQYEQLDREALRVAFGDTERLVQLVTMAPPTVDAFEEISLNLNPVCTNSSLPDDDWKAMHAEVAELAVLSQHLAAEFILVRQGQSFNEKKLDSLLVDLETSVRRIMFGSSQPVLAAPPKQTYFDYMLTTLEPAATTLRTACLTGTVETVLTSSDALFSAARTLQEQYLNEVSDPRWPKERVDLAVSQVAVAYQVFKDALLAVLDMAEHDRSSWNRFEEQQKRLSDLTLVERQDIIAKWEAADSAWQVLQGTLLTPEISRTEKALNDLLVQLRDAIPLYGIEDVQEAEKFPWAICIYSLIGTCILCCCCAFVLWPCLRTKSVGKKDELKHADEPPAAAEEI